MKILRFLGAAALALILGAPLAAAQQVPHPTNGPATSTIGDYACWGNALGAELVDCTLSGAVGGDLAGTLPDPTVVGLTHALVTPTGGNTARSPAAIAGDTLDIADFGALGDATSDDTALTNALIALGGSSGTIVFPRGTWNFTGQFTYTLTASARLTFRGAGADTTVLQWSGTPAGIAVTIASAETSSGCYGASVGVEGLSFVSGVAGGPTAFSTTVTTTCTNPAAAAPSLFRDVTVRGDYNTLFWGSGITITKLSNVNFIADEFVGPTGSTTVAYGAEVLGSSPEYAVAINFQGDTFINLNDGIGFGSYVQGITVNQSNFTELDQCGVYVPPSETGLLDMLTVSNSQFGIVAAGGAGYICVESPISTVNISHNYFVQQSTTAAISIGNIAIDRFIITGNTFTSNSAAEAIYLGQTSGTPIVDDNVFFENTYAIDEAASTASLWLGPGNVYEGLVDGVLHNSGGGGPSLTCGTSPTINGYINNMSGSVTPPSGTTSCTINFLPHWGQIPQCTASLVGNSGSNLSITSVTTSQLTIQKNSAAAFNGTEGFTYACRQ